MRSRGGNRTSKINGPVNILVVDDHRTNRKLLRAVLEAEPFTMKKSKKPIWRDTASGTNPFTVTLWSDQCPASPIRASLSLRESRHDFLAVHWDDDPCEWSAELLFGTMADRWTQFSMAILA